MNIIEVESQCTEVKKELFSLKPIQRDGLILQIHNTTTSCGLQHSKRIRFIRSAFDSSGLVLACADMEGNLFMVDFSCTKYWQIPKLDSCSALAFSTLNNDELLVACNDGNLYAINIHLGNVFGLMDGHRKPIQNISFAQEQCLTASSSQAIIYNLRTFNKIHELSINSATSLKQMFFMPVTNNILACFSDDYIHIWKNNTFESFKKLLPTEWSKFSVQCIAVTRNGTTMILAGLSSQLVIFALDTWSLTKVLTLEDDINVKSADFVSQAHDGGANKYLILLSKNGIIHLLDMEENIVIAKIKHSSEIISFACSFNGTHLSCILRSGEINIHKIVVFIRAAVSEKNLLEIAVVKNPKLKYYLQMKKPKEELDIAKLQGILKEYGEFPEHYRTLIWSKILMLPNNIKSFRAIINKGLNPNFSKLEEKYPIVNRNVLKNLKKLLSHLGNWSPIFCNMEFVPFFVFPFIRIFQNDPLLCFETITTIFINFCQHWFEYAPVAPVNILAMIENVIAEHDAQLLAFLSEQKVTSHLYAWSLLESAFSEILTIKEWCILWDHILSNEPTFLLMVPVAYNILCRSSLATLKSLDEFEVFYHNQNPVGIKKLIGKSYYLLQHTSEARHPRKYFKPFEGLPKGSYPIFSGYPTATVTTGKDKTSSKSKSTSSSSKAIKSKSTSSSSQATKNKSSSKSKSDKLINQNVDKSTHVDQSDKLNLRKNASVGNTELQRKNASSGNSELQRKNASSGNSELQRKNASSGNSELQKKNASVGHSELQRRNTSSGNSELHTKNYSQQMSRTSTRKNKRKEHQDHEDRGVHENYGDDIDHEDDESTSSEEYSGKIDNNEPWEHDHGDSYNESGYGEDSEDIDEIEREIRKVKTEIKTLRKEEAEREEHMNKQREEAERIKHLEDMYQEKLLKEKERADQRRLDLSKLRTQLFEMQADSMAKSRRKIEEKNLEERRRELEKILKQIEYTQKQDELEIQRTEEDLSRHYLELLRQKTILENMLLDSAKDDKILPEKYKLIDLQRETLNKELENMRRNLNASRILTKVNIPLEISVANDKLQRLDMAFAQEMANKQQHLTACNSNIQIIRMENDTKELEKEVGTLLDKFSEVRKDEASQKLINISKCVSGREKLIEKEQELMMLRKQKNLYNESGDFASNRKRSKSSKATSDSK